MSTSSYMVFFRLGSTKLTGGALKTITQAAKEITNLQKYEVILNGHTDRTGSADKNLELALERAENVKKALIKRGVKADRINVFSFGESDQKISTKDGVKEKNNRRVEIFVAS